MILNLNPTRIKPSFRRVTYKISLITLTLPLYNNDHQYSFLSSHSLRKLLFAFLGARGAKRRLATKAVGKLRGRDEGATCEMGRKGKSYIGERICC